MVTQVVMGGNTTTFTYGPDGDRIKKTSASTTLRYPFGDDYEITGGVTTKYIPVGGLGVVAKRVGTGTSHSDASATLWLDGKASDPARA